MATPQTLQDLHKATPPAPATPAGQRDKLVQAVAAKANGAVPPTATSQENKTVETKDRSKTKLVQVNFGLGDDEDTEFRTAIFKAADEAKLSLAAWAKVTLAKAVNVTIAEPVKTAKTEAEKKLAKADDRLLMLYLVRNHKTKLFGADSSQVKSEQNKINAYVKKLAETEGIGAEKAEEIRAASEKATA